MAGGGVSRGGPQGTAQIAAVTVSVKTMEKETIQKTVLLNGDVASKTQTSIYPDTSGKVSRLLRKVGDSVRKGEVIAYVYLYWRARNGHIDEVVERGASYREFHLRATLAAHQLNHRVLGYLLASHLPAVDKHNTVARAHARLVRRSLGYDAKHSDGVGHGVKDYANAVKLALKGFVYLFEHLARYILRVRVQLGE